MATYEDIELIEKPTLVRRMDTPRVLWGDEGSGFVNDLVYAASPELVLMEICMPPGGFYRASDNWKANYDSDGCFYILQGEYTVQFPDTGEVRVAEAGEVIQMNGPQWHYGYNFSDTEARVMEAISPTPPFAVRNDLVIPESPLGFDAKAIKSYPDTRHEGESRLKVITKGTSLPVVVGRDNPLLLRVMSSGELVSTAIFDLLCGRRSDTLCFSKDTAVYVERGRAHVRVPESGGWDELNAGDLFFFPAGTSWDVFNHGDQTANLYLVVAGNIGDELARQ